MSGPNGPEGDTGSGVETEVRRALGALLPPRDPSRPASVLGAGSDDGGAVDAVRDFLRRTVDGGFSVPEWPAEFGGRDARTGDAAAVRRVLRDFAVPDLYPAMVGLYLVGPTLLRHGTDAQRRRWMRPIAAGEHIWCQLFSEPAAGSDLANVATAARREGDGWVLSGQKVWTSRGTYADWGICLARTDPDVPKHGGLTMFAVRMSAPGVQVRPMRQMNGDAHFCETFLTDVEVPDADRVGGVGEGWTVALTVLAQERAAVGRGGFGDEEPDASDGPARGSSSGRAPGWWSELAAAGVLADPVLRGRAADVYIAERVQSWTAARAAARARAATPGPEGSILKLAGGRLFARRATLMTDALGAAGTLAGGRRTVEFLTAPSLSIRGGTDEIQRNIIGERVLGLPGEARVDRDVPWTRSRRGLAGPA